MADCPQCGVELRPAGAAPPLAGAASPDGPAVAVVNGRGIVLREGETVVLGRATGRADVDAAFDGLTGVSKWHAELRRQGAAVTIRDCGSTNGTWLGQREVRGAPVTRPLPLTLRLGRTAVELRWPAPAELAAPSWPGGGHGR
ncbi:MAG: FHA domain-containing protein [Bifidobacteriaceae bacterium]|jgi:pSer/pThr/pTyr-binding forkhead associated (FHA) protein|nr:FHA domain-containing protein [Bifidobacteriaceae bacterium]